MSGREQQKLCVVDETHRGTSATFGQSSLMCEEDILTQLCDQSQLWDSENELKCLTLKGIAYGFVHDSRPTRF